MSRLRMKDCSEIHYLPIHNADDNLYSSALRSLQYHAVRHACEFIICEKMKPVTDIQGNQKRLIIVIIQANVTVRNYRGFFKPFYKARYFRRVYRLARHLGKELYDFRQIQTKADFARILDDFRGTVNLRTAVSNQNCDYPFQFWSFQDPLGDTSLYM